MKTKTREEKKEKENEKKDEEVKKEEEVNCLLYTSPSPRD